MTLPPFHPDAEWEMNDEAAYYEKKAEGLGEDFLSEVHSVAIAATRKSESREPRGALRSAAITYSFPALARVRPVQ